MTVHDQPRPPLEMQVLDYLKVRMDLEKDQRKNYFNIQKGYLGEVKFSNLLDEELASPCRRLFDLSLKTDNDEFQIDVLLLYHKKILHLEVKNFEGDFCFHNDNWYVMKTKKEIKSPLLQLKRSNLLLGELLLKLGYDFKVESFVIFIHPEFNLYQAPTDSSLVFPTQLPRFMKSLNRIPANLNPSHSKLAEELIQLHNENFPSKHLPDYQFESLSKGIVCENCSSFLTSRKGNYLHCDVCLQKEAVNKSVIRSAVEFNLLFPGQKITTQVIYEWCGRTVSTKAIRRTLQDSHHFASFGNTSQTYYVLKSEQPTN